MASRNHVFMHMICMLPQVTKLVYDDQRLILGSLWTLGECAQAPFSCISIPGGFCFLDTFNSMMSSSYPN
jgi:hypothetical protein